MKAFDPHTVRDDFPALSRQVDGQPVIFLDGPGGTQSPVAVIEAMAGYLRSGSSNLGGPFLTSRETGVVAANARKAMADLFGARSTDEIAFGQNMTSLTFSVSRALSRTWVEGDEIVLTRLDHDANITPWTMAAADRGVTVRWADFDPESGCGLDMDSMEAAIGQRTKLVAVTHASNAVGTIVDVGRVGAMAHAVGALMYVDAVHFTPHRPVDVVAIDADFLVASAYKFFGPHTGVLYGKREHLAMLDAYKVRPAPGEPPGKWETGTQSFESLAGVTAAVGYIARLSGETSVDRRAAILLGMQRIGAHETALASRFLTGAAEVPGLTVHGRQGATGRTPTFAVSVEGLTPDKVADRLGSEGIFVWSGHYYAVEVMRRLGFSSGGLVRIGFTHYNTDDEVDRLLNALEALAVEG